MRRKFVAGNWKMHGNFQQNSVLLENIKARIKNLACEVAVCVPYPYLAQAQTALVGSEIGLGAQNLSEHVAGAYTGEVSAAMLREFSCRYVLVGHSERRALYGESDAVVAAKFAAAQASGMQQVLCVGESLAERQSGLTGEVISRQLAAVLSLVGVAAMVNAVVGL